VFSVAFSPDGKTLAWGGADCAIRLWDVAARRELVAFKAHADSVNAVAFSPNGQTLASAGLDGALKLWDVSNLLNRRRCK
jgi:WD40 repeat protein